MTTPKIAQNIPQTFPVRDASGRLCVLRETPWQIGILWHHGSRGRH